MHFHQLADHLEKSPSEFIWLRHLERSHKFYVGDIHWLPYTAGEGAMPRLPYTDCAFEFLGDSNHPGDENPLSRMKFIVLCRELLTQQMLMMEVFICLDARWKFIFEAQFDRVRSRYRFSRGGEIDPSGAQLNPALPWSGKQWDQPPVWASPNDEEKVNSFKRFLIGPVLNTLAVLNCTNVTTETVVASPKLNKKRLRNRKAPIPDYDILILRRHANARLSLGSAGNNSPILHWRRGHIKRRRTGNFWWQPHLVGDPAVGFKRKDYRADRLMEQAKPKS